MGKSPGKWIKTVLFGKKSSKSNTSRGREKVANEREVLVAVKASEADGAFDPPFASHQTSNTTQTNERKLVPEDKESANISDDGRVPLPGNQVAHSLNFTTPDASYDPEKIREEKAAVKAQAAFRGYLARRAFWALKGIIRLQALIRGHLVRRQAVATWHSMLGIVKLQAIVRGKKESKPVDSAGHNVPIRITKLSANAFVCKLLASSPTVMPLRLQYDSAEPNSVSNWLKRWSASRFWKPVPQPKKVADSKPQKKQVNGHTVEAETGRPKRSVRRVPSANADSISLQSTSEFDKVKRNFKKVSSHPVDPVHENPQNELEKVKRSLRKVHNPVVENSVSVQSEVEFENPKQSLEKVSSTLGHEVLEQSMGSTGEKMKETTLTSSKPVDVETTPEALELNETSDLPLGELTAIELKPSMDNGKDDIISLTNGEFNPKEDSTNNDNNKSSRKTSTPAKQERAENGLQSPTIPSYMAATESAKAKLRLQGSPRSGPDVAEKNSGSRRQSLPSSTNSKISSQSPRTQRPVHSGGKGSNKSDKTQLSSKDGSAKVTQVEWRR